MNSKRQIEIFSAGCSICTEAVEMIKRMACPSCEVTTLDMRDLDRVFRPNPKP
jgi:glutaredoxin 3